MTIGNVIREHRKKIAITQEEMAGRLGVTAPAVNKWENGVSQPDIMLLAPIARLLHISLDTLLCYQEELTTEEINRIVLELNHKLQTEPYEDVFQWGKKNLEQNPSCHQLLWQTALILDTWRMTKGVEDSERYDALILAWYECALDSQDESIRNHAADSLYGFYFRKEDYEKAGEYLKYFSGQNPERKRKQADLYSKTGRVTEAFQSYEELLLSGCQMLTLIFRSLYLLAVQNQDMEKAEFLVEKQSRLSNVFDMGEYHEASYRLDLAAAAKDVAATLEIVEKMLTCSNTICSFTESVLYEHMNFRAVSKEFSDRLSADLRACFKDEEAYAYMKGNEAWEKLLAFQIQN